MYKLGDKIRRRGEFKIGLVIGMDAMKFLNKYTVLYDTESPVDVLLHQEAYEQARKDGKIRFLYEAAVTDPVYKENE